MKAFTLKNGRKEQTVRPKGTILALVVMLALVFQTQSVVAQQTTFDCHDVESCARLGSELFQNEEFLEAALVLSRAYSFESIDVLLYNIARAYQRADRCVMASDYFNRYLNTGDVNARTQANQHEPDQTRCANRYHSLMEEANDAINAANLEQAKRLLVQARNVSDEPEARMLYLQTLLTMGGEENCQEVISLYDQFEPMIDFTSTQRGDLERQRQRAEQCLEQIEVAERRRECETERAQVEAEWREGVKGKQTIGLIVTGVGAAVLVGAMIHDLASGSLIDDYEHAASTGDAAGYDDLRDDISSAKTLSWILYGVGSAGTIAGIVIWLTAEGANPADDIDCTRISSTWDFGFGTPTGDAGLWIRGVF